MTARPLIAAAALVGAAVALRAASPAALPGRPAAPARPSAYADGAPPGFSGGFGEATCHGCHFHEAPNAAPGRVTLAGVPEQFDPGARYTLTIRLTRPGMAAGGFQLTARREAGGVQAGALEAGPADRDRVKVDRPDRVDYAGQRRAGSRPVVEDHLEWTIVWTAPAGDGPVVFHVAANAVNSDEAVTGDFVYTTTGRTSPRAH